MSKVILVLFVIFLSSCFAPRYRYPSYYKKPTRREINKAMKYSDWRFSNIKKGQ